MNHKDLWNRITSNGMREMTEDRFYQALKEIDLPESKEIDNNRDWLSPIQSEREHQEKQLKELWPDYPNGCPKWQTMNGLIFYTNQYLRLSKSDGWIPVSKIQERIEILEHQNWGNNEIIIGRMARIDELKMLCGKEETCKNCAQREGEECGIDGTEVYDDFTCRNWCKNS